MSVDPRCADVRIDSEAELNALARELHGKRFRQLSDEESRQVWDALTAVPAELLASDNEIAETAALAGRPVRVIRLPQFLTRGTRW